MRSERRFGIQESAAGRGAWSFLDQVASSLSNYALFIVIARSAGVDGLGAFSVAYAAFAIILGTVRGPSSDSLIVRFSARPHAELVDAGQAATGFVLVCGTAVGIALIAVGLVVGSRVGPPLVALGIVLPGVLIQDTCRFIFIVDRRPQRAFAIDTFWLLVLAVAIAVLAAEGHQSVFAWLLTWGLAGTGGAILGVGLLRRLPDPRAGWRWWRSHRDIGVPFVGAFLVDRGSSQLGFTLVGAIGGLTALGALTAARALFAPVTTVLSATSSFAVAEGTRLRGSSMSIRRYSWSVAAALASMPIGLALFLYFGPQQLGRLLVGKSWPAARGVLIPVSLFSAALAAALGPFIGLKVIQAAKATLRTELAVAPFSVAAPLVGDHFWGVQGAAYGLLVSGLLSLVFWVWVFEARTRTRGGPREDKAGRLIESRQIDMRGGGSVGDEQIQPGGTRTDRSNDMARRAEAAFAALEGQTDSGTGAAPDETAPPVETAAPVETTVNQTVTADSSLVADVEAPVQFEAATPPVDSEDRLRRIEDRLMVLEECMHVVLIRMGQPSDQQP